jgi:hypothetical protein
MHQLSQRCFINHQARGKLFFSSLHSSLDVSEVIQLIATAKSISSLHLPTETDAGLDTSSTKTTARAPSSALNILRLVDTTQMQGEGSHA